MSEDKKEDKTYVALWANYNIDGKTEKEREDGRGFMNQALGEANGRRSKYYSSAYEYKTGEEFIKALTSAYLLSSAEDLSGLYIRRPIHLVNIFGHGVPAGLTSPYHGARGIYSISISDQQLDRAGGGRLITDLRPEIFAADAVIVIHNCSTSLNFAVAFLQHLVRNGKNDAKVIAHQNLVGTSFNIEWFEHTKANPGGVLRGPLGRDYWLHPGPLKK